MRLLRLLLFPFSFFYALVVIIRNWAYDIGILKSRRFKVPVISVGNLSVGGAGKSPMTEYLVGILKDDFKVATLSRGYGRRTKGFLAVKTSSIAEDIGDEPLQFKRKFPEITVAVCEDRVEGIKELNRHHDVIVLDDAFQHRAVKPGLSIVLFDYGSLWKFQWFLPTGDLREPLSGRKRADIIVITKAPEGLSEEERRDLTVKVAPFPHQQVFFSSFQYASLLDIAGSRSELNLSDVKPDTHVLLLTGIANPAPLIEHIKLFSANISHYQYPDHHQFTKKNIIKLVREFKGITSSDKIIITTEKDAQRLNSYHLQELLRALPVYYLPVKAAIQSPDEERFNDLIIEYVRKHPVNHRVHKA
ncbi:tetraacyldisaccharide 4'-kinase [Flavihumibacter sp. R14]|nr:tetraacyldisaccharide 4'-kinase [Flavihumibacter soli]